MIPAAEARMITRERDRRGAVGKACQRGEDPGQLCLVGRLRGLASVDVVEHQADPLAVVERSPQPRSGNRARKVCRDNGLAAVETRFDRPVIADRLGEHSASVRQPEPRRKPGREAARLAAGGHHLAARDRFDLLTSRRRQFVPNKAPPTCCFDDYLHWWRRGTSSSRALFAGLT
jgi:hypothetical protein